LQYIIDNDLDFAYWPAIGYLENGWGNGWALQNWDKTGKRDGIHDGNDWRLESWTRLVNATTYKTGPVDVVPIWQMLSIDHEDYVKSVSLSNAFFLHCVLNKHSSAVSTAMTGTTVPARPHVPMVCA